MIDLVFVEHFHDLVQLAVGEACKKQEESKSESKKEIFRLVFTEPSFSAANRLIASLSSSKGNPGGA